MLPSAKFGIVTLEIGSKTLFSCELEVADREFVISTFVLGVVE